jgi:hypothetical protein
MVHFQSSPG